MGIYPSKEQFWHRNKNLYLSILRSVIIKSGFKSSILASHKKMQKSAGKNQKMQKKVKMCQKFTEKAKK